MHANVILSQYRVKEWSFKAQVMGQNLYFSDEKLYVQHRSSKHIFQHMVEIMGTTDLKIIPKTPKHTLTITTWGIMLKGGVFLHSQSLKQSLEHLKMVRYVERYTERFIQKASNFEEKILFYFYFQCHQICKVCSLRSRLVL